jgi:hypothetical protein
LSARRLRAKTSTKGNTIHDTREATRHESGQIEDLLDAMTLEEQVALLAGADFWTTVPIPG